MTEPTTFREAYEVLQRHAQQLRDADEPNIDSLLSVVTESVAAYKICKQRIDAVEAALKEALAEVGGEGSQSTRPATEEARNTATSTSFPAPARSKPARRAESDADDDVPF